MKKLTIFFILSLLMCLAMAFPAFSAHTLTTAAQNHLNMFLNYTNWSGYNYHFVYQNPSNLNYIHVLSFKVPNPSVRSEYRHTQFWDSKSAVAGVYYWKGLSESASTTGKYGWEAYTTSSGNSVVGSNISYVLIDYCSVTVPDALKPSTVVTFIDIAALQTLINTSKSKTNIDYTSTSWQALQSALTAAENLLKITGYTQAQVDAARNTLQAALDGLVLLPDISALQALINAAKSESSEDYTSDTWESLQSAITAAESLINTQNYTQAQIDAAKNALQAALDGLTVPIPALPDTTELRILLDEADAIEDIGYTAPTWTRFDNARTSGHSLLARPVYTEPEVSATSAELSASMNGLTLQTVISPPLPSSDGYNLGTGDISGFLAPSYGIFSSYIFSINPILIGFFAIIFGIKLIPHVFTRIFSGFRR